MRGAGFVIETKTRIALSLLSGISYGGVTYFRHLIPALARQDRVNEYFVFLPKDHELNGCVRQGNVKFCEVDFDAKHAVIRHAWEQFVLPVIIRRRGIDILFTAKNANVLLAPCETVVSIRNMEPLCFERYDNNSKLNFFSWLRRINTMVSARKADRIIAVSQAAKKRLVELMPSTADKIDVIYNGNPCDLNECEKEVAQPRENFLLTASKFVAYANQLNLIKGYLLLANRIKDLPPLWLAGGVLDKQYHKKVREVVSNNGLNERIVFLGLVPHEELLSLYRRARAFIFPSTLEACPHTLIEAMASGLPIAASKMAPMPEISGDGAVYFDPSNPTDIAEKIELLLKDKELGLRLVAQARDRAHFFSWDETARQLIRVFEEVGGKWEMRPS